jgi:hypothetical protein
MAEMSVIWLRAATALYSIGLLHAILTVVRKRERPLPRVSGRSLYRRCAALCLDRRRSAAHESLPHRQYLRNAFNVSLVHNHGLQVALLAVEDAATRV